MSTEDSSPDVQSMSDVVDRIGDIAERQDSVSINDVLEEFGNRSFAPFMLILAIIGVTPVGGIPGVPSFIAASIIAVAAQMMIGRDHIWLPSFITERSAGSDKLLKGNDKLDQMAKALDRMAQGRLQVLASGPFLRVVAGLIIVLCCAVPPFELIPFAAAIPFFSIAILSLAMIVRDGLVMLIGALVSLSAMAAGLYWYLY